MVVVPAGTVISVPVGFPAGDIHSAKAGLSVFCGPSQPPNSHRYKAGTWPVGSGLKVSASTLLLPISIKIDKQTMAKAPNINKFNTSLKYLLVFRATLIDAWRIVNILLKVFYLILKKLNRFLKLPRLQRVVP